MAGPIVRFAFGYSSITAAANKCAQECLKLFRYSESFFICSSFIVQNIFQRVRWSLTGLAPAALHMLSQIPDCENGKIIQPHVPKSDDHGTVLQALPRARGYQGHTPAAASFVLPTLVDQLALGLAHHLGQHEPWMVQRQPMQQTPQPSRSPTSFPFEYINHNFFTSPPIKNLPS